MRSVSITVRGRVQGVWFRASTKNEAVRLGLTGTVRNQPDGSVYIEAQGPSHQIESLIVWCHKGPELARVDEVEVVDISRFVAESFEVVRSL